MAAVNVNHDIWSIPTADAELLSLPGNVVDIDEEDADEATTEALPASRPSEISLPGSGLAASLLLEEVDRLVTKHRIEVYACFDNWLRRVESEEDQLSRQNSRWSEAGTGQLFHMPSQGSTAFHMLKNDLRKNPSEKITGEGNCVTTASSRRSRARPTTKSLWTIGKQRKVFADRTASRRKKTRKANQELFRSRAAQALQSQTCLQRIFASRYYEWSSGLLISLNAIFMGYQTQWIARQAEAAAVSGVPRSEETPAPFVAVQVLFVILFTVELALRWTSEGLIEFFQDSDRWWNVLDVWVVAIGMLDLIFEAFVDMTGVLSNISVLRVMRVVRVVRVARVIRIMKFFRELRMMIFSILGSMKSLVWVILVLMMTFYVFGITFTSAATSELDTIAKWTAPENVALIEHFGRVDKSIISLFMAMSGGNDWGMYYDAIKVLSLPYKMIFLLFISFSVFAVVNIVTGVFVESALQSNNKDRDIIVHEELENKKEYLNSLAQIFEDIDDDDSGAITLEEFEAKLDDERVIAYFNALRLDASDARTLFWLLDYDHSDEVNIHEFLSGCYKLQGESRNLDMKLMQCEVRSLKEGMTTQTGIVREMQVMVEGLHRVHFPHQTLVKN